MRKREVKPLLERVNYVRIGKSPLDDACGWCDACGAFTPYRYEPVINDDLAGEWKLTKQLRQDFSARESRACVFCGCSYRLRMMARALRQVVIGSEAVSLQESIEAGDFQGLKIAEINSCGKLHGILQELPGLKYSEFASGDPAIPHEDLMKLSYADSSFDIVLTSDTLEHVPDVKQALSEIYRVLKPGGVHVCTVPWVLTRSTVMRTRLGVSGEEHPLPSSFHGSGEPDYLVWSEFGADFLDDNEQAGFACTILYQHMPDWNSPSGLLMAKRTTVSGTELLYVDSVASDKELAALRAELQQHAVRRKIIPLISGQVLELSEYRLKKLERLARKLLLTEDHANNQTVHLAELDAKFADLRLQYESQTQELEKVRSVLASIPQARARRAIKRVLRR